MSVRGTFHAILLSVSALLPAQAQNVFVAPGSSGSTVGAYSPDPFESSGTVAGSSQTSAVYGLPSGKYYVVTGGSTSSVATYNSSLAAVGAVSGLGTITGSAFSPDARYLAVLTRSGLKLVDTQTDLVVGSFDSSQIGAEPYDAAFSLDGKRLFVVSSATRTVYAVDVSGSTPSLTSGTVAVTGGTLPVLLTVAPNGVLYASTQNRIYEIDGQAMVSSNQISLTGNPGRIVFVPDMSVGVTVNQNPANGNSVLFAFNPSTRSVTGTISNSVNDTLGKLVYAGPSSSGYRFYASSTQKQLLYEIAYPNLAMTSSMVFAKDFGPVTGIVTTGEVTAPQYLFVGDTSTLYRVALSKTGGQLSGDPIHQVTAPGALFFAGPKNGVTTGQILTYNATQSIASDGSFSQITARVLDTAGRPMSAAPIKFAASGVTFTNASTATNADGWAFATPQNPGAAGTYNLTVTAGTQTANGKLTVTGTSGGGGDGGGGGTTGGIAAISGQGQLFETFTIIEPVVVQVTDATGKPIAKTTVTFTLDTAAATIGNLTSSPGGAQYAGSVCTNSTTCSGTTDSNGKIGVSFLPVAAINQGAYKQGNIIAKTSDSKSTSVPLTVVSRTALLTYELVKPAGASVTVPAGAKVAGAFVAKVLVYDPAVGVPTPLSNIALSATTDITDPAAGPTVSCNGSGGITLTDSTGTGTCDLVVGPTTGSTVMTMEIGNRQFTAILNVVAGAPAHLTIQQGNNQSGNAGQQLPQALVAVVTDAGGSALAGQKVTWTVGNAQGVTLSNVVTTSDSNGRVSATATLGTAPGAQTVSVALSGNTAISATFTLTVNASIGTLTITGGNNQSALINTPFGQPLVVQVLDQSNKPLPGVAVSFNVQGSGVTLSAGSAPTDAQGNASVSAVAGGTAGTVTVVASTGNLSQSFTLTVRPPGPVFGLNNLLNGASFQVQGQVAPGQILTITGNGVSNGANGVILPNTLLGPLPTTLNGVQVIFTNTQNSLGIAAPIYNVANVNGHEQVTVLVPFELQPGTVNLTIKAGGTTSDPPLQVPVVAAQPGIFESVDANNNRFAVVLHADGSYVTPTSPATRGETLRYFATSLGQTTPAAATNHAGVANQMVNNTIIVGVADAGVQIIQAKYVENFVGLYTVDFVVPSDAPSGTQIKLNMALITSDGTAYYSNASSFAIQ
jgi:uncharacterized protein (TIGR03437 family)